MDFGVAEPRPQGERTGAGLLPTIPRRERGMGRVPSRAAQNSNVKGARRPYGSTS